MNRSKPQSAAIQLGPALGVLVFCALLGGVGLGYVGQKKNIESLGETIAKHEIEKARLIEIRRRYDRTYGFLTSRDSLEELIRLHRLDLRQPAPNQVVTLDERERGAASERFAADPARDSRNRYVSNSR